MRPDAEQTWEAGGPGAQLQKGGNAMVGGNGSLQTRPRLAGLQKYTVLASSACLLLFRFGQLSGAPPIADRCCDNGENLEGEQKICAKAPGGGH